jgi:Flp pilus assembly protein TadD
MASAELNGAAIVDAASFHAESRRAFGFPDYYANTMDAWVDCLSYLRDQDGMSKFRLKPAEVLESVVKDAAGKPLDKVEVTIVSSKLGSQKFDFQTDREGRFTQIGLSPGFYLVNFKKEGFASRSIEVKVSIAEATRFEVTLETTGAEAERMMSASDKLFVQGNKLYAENKFAEAAASYEEAIKLSQTQWAYYFNLGLTFKKMDKGEEARAAFSRALELNPGSYSANKELAENLARAGKYEEAKALYRKALEISADEPDVLYNLGLCQASTGEAEAAVESFVKCVALKPDYADAYYQLGTLYIGQNKVKEAIENLEKFLELAPAHEKASVARQLLDYLKKQAATS